MFFLFKYKPLKVVKIKYTPMFQIQTIYFLLYHLFILSDTDLYSYFAIIRQFQRTVNKRGRFSWDILAWLIEWNYESFEFPSIYGDKRKNQDLSKLFWLYLLWNSKMKCTSAFFHVGDGLIKFSIWRFVFCLSSST